VKLPVFFSLASGNLQTGMGLRWAEEGGQVVLFMYGLGWKKGNFTLYLEPLVWQQVKS